jgi:hypothetical protein
MPEWPGSLAIDDGSNIEGLSTDQRGAARTMGNAPDIGAFESMGFDLSYASGSNQTATVNKAFSAPLTVTVTSMETGIPVAGGVITYTGPTSGAGLQPSTTTATITANGQAALTANANATTGSYAVMASANGVTGTATFDLTNLAAPVFNPAVSVSWGSADTAALSTASDGLRLLPAGRSTDLDWLGINKITLTLTQPATIAPGDVTVTGINLANYGPVMVSGSGTSTITLTLAVAINTADRVTVTIANATIPTYTRRLDVLPGDFNDDGSVNAQDLVGIRNEQVGYTPDGNMIFADIDGSGMVDTTDANDAKKFVGKKLPS